MDEGDERKDWRSDASDAGYEVMTKADLDSMRKDVNAAKDFRASLPEEYRDDPSKFFSEATSAFDAVKKYKAGDQTEVEQLQGDIKTLKGQNTKLTNQLEESNGKVKNLGKENHSLNMWGHVGRIQQLRNVSVDSMFIEETAVTNFDTSSFNMSDEKGIEEFQNAVWKDILEPAVKKQEQVVSRVSAGRPSPRQDQNGSQDGPNPNDAPPTPAWGMRL